MLSRLESWLGTWVVRYAGRIIVLSLAAAALSIYGVRFLTITNDSRVYFSKENPQLQAFEALERVYSKDNHVIFVLAPRSGNVFTREVLSAVSDLTGASWKLPYSSRVDSLINFQHVYAEGDELIVENLVRDPTGLTDEELGRIREIALGEQNLVNRIVSPTGHVTGVRVLITAPGKTLNETPEVTEAARKLADEFRSAHPDIKLYLSGGILLDSAFGEAARNDMKTLVPGMLLVLFMILGLALRSVGGTLSTLLVVVLSSLTGLGLAGWLGMALNPSSVNAATICLTLAVADSVHILVTLFHGLREGKSRQEAVAESLRLNLQPVFLTSFTTAIGFLSMNFSDAPPFRDLGNIVAMGVTAAFLYSILLLPAMAAVLPFGPSARGTGVVRDRGGLDGLARFVVRRRRAIFWGLTGLTVLLISGVFRNVLDDDFIKYFDHRYEIRRATDFLEENLTGLYVIDYSLESGEPGGIHDPAYLKVLDDFCTWYEGQPNVVSVSTFSRIMKRLNKSMHGDDESYYRLPESRELAAQYLLLFEMSLPFGLDLNKTINVEKSSTRVSVTMRHTSMKEIRETDERAVAWLRSHAPPSMQTVGTGLTIMFSHISERNIRSMLGGSLLGLVLISAVMILALKSVRMGLMSLIPNLTPAFMALGLWGYLVGEVGLTVSVLAALTMGIVVDDTVHFMTKYLRARREQGLAPAEAVRYSFHTVGTALWVTTVVLVAGFLVLAVSGFKINADMGLMTAVTLAIALLMDFLLLPVLLLMADGAWSPDAVPEEGG